MLSGFLATMLLSNLLTPALGLRTAQGSPCAGVCHQASTNTTPSEIVCLDPKYNQTTKGRDFESCVSCQLQSTYYDYSAGQSEVDWGLYNLRYAFSSCVYGFPVSMTNISSPCPVACQAISPAIALGLRNPNSFNFNSWCKAPSYADNVIDSCEQCYNWTSNQVYLANFLEAIRYNCHFPSVTQHSFKIAPSRIFSELLLPSSESYASPTPAPSAHVNLPVVIAVPIVGFLIIVGAVTTCCIFFIRWRRRRARRSRLSNHPYEWNDIAMVQAQWGDQQQQEQMYAAQLQQYEQQMYAAQYAGFNFVDADADGQGQQVGYGHYHQKPGFSEEISESPVVNPHAVTSHAFEPEKLWK